MILKGKKIKIIIAVFILLAGGAVASFYFNKNDKVEYTVEKVKRGKLIQTVNETGAVKSVSEINLNFLNSGRLANILVRVGDKVVKDQILAELDYSGLVIKKEEAQANLNIAQANLNKLIAGATYEEIVVSQASVNEAEAAYLSAIKELEKVKKVVAENIKQAQKSLDDLESGSSSNVTTYEKAVEVAQTTLNNTKSTYAQSVSNKESAALTAIETKLVEDNTAIDTINTVITNTDSSDVLSIKNTSYLASTKETRDKAITYLATAENSLSIAEASKTEDNINQALSDALTALNKTLEALNYCYSALENTVTSSLFTQTELDAAKTSISAQLTIINSGISSIQTADQNLQDARLAYDTNVSTAEKGLTQSQTNLDNAILTAQNSLNTAKINGEKDTTLAQNKVNATLKAWEAAKAGLAKIKATARREDLALKQAEVSQTQAALDSINNQIEGSIIKAPIDGQITKVNYEIGEQPTAQETVVSILGVNNFEIESLISESDIAKVRVGDGAEITLDAFGDEVKFPGKVYFIEPAETKIQDVIYYKVKIEFTATAEEFKNNEAGIKSGMTANVIISAMKKDNVLIMPFRAVVSKNGQGKFVKILKGKNVEEVPVKIGPLGDEGMVEVLSGVKEGDEVVTFTKNNK